MENKKNRYVIGKNVYEKHIDDEVHLYGLLHQLAAQAERIRDEEDVFHLLDTVKKYGAIADEMFDGWGIPGRYLVFGEKKDLEGLRERELTKLSDILAEHDAETMSKALEQASWNLPYIIHGSSFRLLVGSIFELLARYCSLKRRILEVKTEKDFLRLQKQTTRSTKQSPAGSTRLTADGGLRYSCEYLMSRKNACGLNHIHLLRWWIRWLLGRMESWTFV